MKQRKRHAGRTRKDKRRQRIIRAWTARIFVLSVSLLIICAIAQSMILISRKFQEEEPVFAGASRILSDTGSSDTLTVVVDAGHGGKDQGTNSQDILEKDVNLSVARLLAKNLEKAGAQVIMTRTADTYIGLEERAQLANDAKADLFISVHCNYCEDDASVQGLECYYSKDSTGGQILAETISDQMDTIDQTVSRGARTADYRVLLRTEMPAVLIELGYFSNSSECRKLATSEYQSLLAENIAEAVMNEQTIAAAVTDTPQ